MFLKRVLSIPSLVRHVNILHAVPVPGEAIIGWVVHYVIGVIFASGLLLVMGTGWALEPTFPPALLMGMFTIAAPFLIMQPGFGFGIAASKTPAPKTVRLRSLMTHTVFGVGLYIAALLTSAIG